MNHPLIVITNIRPIEGEREPEISIKALAASLGRSDCGFPIMLLRNEETPLFRIRRAGLAEVSVSTSNRHLLEADPADATREAVLRLSECVNTDGHPWIIVLDQAGVALRNIEHLIPEDATGPFPGKQADFYWAAEQGRPDRATTGIWAVRGHLLETVLSEWRKTLEEIPDATEAWTETIRRLPLRKKRFETGEVAAPDVHSVDWDAVTHAAFVTVPDWPSEARRKFLQSLYFGTWFGDSSGLMLNILES